MAATQTLPQDLRNDNSRASLLPRHGVITLHGYGIRVYVDRGHLIVQDGIAADRREARFSRVSHGLRRLVVIGSDGQVSLGALRWLADQDASLVMLDRVGAVLATTGPVRPSDARLRRAQALAHHSGKALGISKELIRNKLLGQEQLICSRISDLSTVQVIAEARAALKDAHSVEEVRKYEAQAGLAYWTSWRSIPINFPKSDLQRVPNHWRRFGNRNSPLTGSSRLAVNPPNAMLNYLYALLESETRLALAALGLDPGIGVLHMDAPARDSLACDVMEPIRPLVDAYVFDWITREPLRREWFFEERDGNCRLMGAFARRLAETAPTWAMAVAPRAEWIAREFWARKKKSSQDSQPPTRLTQSLRRQARGISPDIKLPQPPRPVRICRSCGAILKRGLNYCSFCSTELSRKNVLEAAKLGRLATHQPKAEALRANTMRRHAAAKRAWKKDELPKWLDEAAYQSRILPRLSKVSASAIALSLGISKPYATEIKKKFRIPHPRHWARLAVLVGISLVG